MGAAALGRRPAVALRRGPDRAGRGRGVLPPDVRGHGARRERDRRRLARSREDGASGERARERLDTTRSRPGSRDDPRVLRAAPAPRVARGRGARDRGSEQRAPRPDADRLRLRSSWPRARSRRSSARRRSSCGRAARSRSTPGSSTAAFRRSRPASASRASATCTRRTRTCPEDAIELGVATMREVFVRLGELGG